MATNSGNLYLDLKDEKIDETLKENSSIKKSPPDSPDPEHNFRRGSCSSIDSSNDPMNFSRSS